MSPFFTRVEKVKIGFFFAPLKKRNESNHRCRAHASLPCRASATRPAGCRHDQPLPTGPRHPCRFICFCSSNRTQKCCSPHLPWPWPLPMREDALLKGADRARIASPGPAASFSSHHHLLHLLLFIHLPGRTRRTAASEIARPRLVPSSLGSAPLTHGENSACSVGLAGGRGRGLVRPAAAGAPPSLPLALNCPLPSSPESGRLPAKFGRFIRWICEAIAPSGPKVAALTSRVLPF